ncbi:hypothetical protein, partial [Schaedlerella sp.]|uniref:hypothetical protein n=1 Tax=Schaedlerella sp. TaxID=2676057 RepID=UPI0037463370
HGKDPCHAAKQDADNKPYDKHSFLLSTLYLVLKNRCTFFYFETDPDMETRFQLSVSIKPVLIQYAPFHF